MARETCAEVSRMSDSTWWEQGEMERDSAKQHRECFSSHLSADTPHFSTPVSSDSGGSRKFRKYRDSLAGSPQSPVRSSSRFTTNDFKRRSFMASSPAATRLLGGPPKSPFSVEKCSLELAGMGLSQESSLRRQRMALGLREKLRKHRRQLMDRRKREARKGEDGRCEARHILSGLGMTEMMDEFNEEEIERMVNEEMGQEWEIQRKRDEAMVRLCENRDRRLESVHCADDSSDHSSVCSVMCPFCRRGCLTMSMDVVDSVTTMESSGHRPPSIAGVRYACTDLGCLVEFAISNREFAQKLKEKCRSKSEVKSAMLSTIQSRLNWLFNQHIKERGCFEELRFELVDNGGDLANQECFARLFCVSCGLREFVV